MGPHIGDPALDQPIKISPIPLGLSSGIYSYTSGQVNATSILVITWTTTVTNPQLTLWNFRSTLITGLDIIDEYRWPNGTSLGANEKNIFYTWWTDQNLSNDFENSPVNKYIIRNDSGSDIPITHRFKSYKFAITAGGN